MRNCKDSAKVPVVLTYMDKPVELCTPEELIAALHDAWKEIVLLRELQRIRSHIDAVQQLSGLRHGQ